MGRTDDRRSANACVLVVEDYPDSRQAMKRILETAGYRVVAAENGVEALAILGAEPVDLIVSDILMPRMNGYQLYEQVVEHPHWVRIPFLFLTALGDVGDMVYGKSLGIDDYLVKPVDSEELVAAVCGRLRRAPQLAGSELHGGVPGEAQAELVVGPLTIDTGRHRVKLDGKQLSFSVTEFRVLECLARRHQTVVTLQELVKVSHGLDTDPVEAGTLLRSVIRSLRRKLGYAAGDLGCIVNVRGIGYQLDFATDS